MVPRAGATALAGIRDGRLLVRLAAPPVDNAANDALVAFVARCLKIPPRNVALDSGPRSRNKQLKISGVTEDYVRKVLTSPRR